MTGHRAEYAARTHRGPVRTTNQDALVVDGWVAQVAGTAVAGERTLVDDLDRLVLAVVDGMGGYAGGDLAALITAHSLAQALAVAPPALDDQDWVAVFEHAGQYVGAAAAALPDVADMGATAAVAVLTGTQLMVANIGDCRVYRLWQGFLTQLSIDDRVPDPRRPGASLVTQAVGRSGAVDPHPLAVPVEPGTTYVLCSDGIHDVVEDADLQRALESAPTSAAAAEALIDLAEAGGFPDNATVVVVRIHPPVG